MIEGFGKIFESVFERSMVGSGPHVISVWAYVLAKTKPPGHIVLNPTVLAAIIGTDAESIEKAIEFLCAPDPMSNNKAHDGRRLLHIGAFKYEVVSFEIYRNKRSEIARKEYKREYMREYMREKRDEQDNKGDSVRQLLDNVRPPLDHVRPKQKQKQKQKQNSTLNVLVLSGDKEGLQGEMMKDGQDKPAPASGKSKKKVQTAEDIITEFENDATYAGINVRNQWGRMAAWCRTNHKHPTKRRFINWLNRVDVPIKGESEPQMSAMNSACSNRYAVKDYKITDKKPNAKNGTTAHQPTHQPSNSANGASFY